MKFTTTLLIALCIPMSAGCGSLLPAAKSAGDVLLPVAAEKLLEIAAAKLSEPIDPATAVCIEIPVPESDYVEGRVIAVCMADGVSGGLVDE